MNMASMAGLQAATFLPSCANEDAGCDHAAHCLRDPDSNQRIVLEEVARLSDRLVVMSEQSAQCLREVYAIPNEKIDIIPHGVPDFQFMDPQLLQRPVRY